MTADNDNRNDDLIDRTCEHWERHFGQRVTRDEGMEIAMNALNFFTILAQWLVSDIKSSITDNDHDVAPDDGRARRDH
jgi:hypothetical protein